MADPFGDPNFGRKVLFFRFFDEISTFRRKVHFSRFSTKSPLFLGKSAPEQPSASRQPAASQPPASAKTGCPRAVRGLRGRSRGRSRQLRARSRGSRASQPPASRQPASQPASQPPASRQPAASQPPAGADPAGPAAGSPASWRRLARQPGICWLGLAVGSPRPTDLGRQSAMASVASLDACKQVASDARSPELRHVT